MSSVTYTNSRSLLIYRVPTGLHYEYFYPSAIDHLRKFGRITVYYYRTRQSYIRHHTNVFIVPDFINTLPLSRRVYFIDQIIQLLATIPLHKPLHLDLNDYPELFI